MTRTFDPAFHEKLLDLLAASNYVPDYLEFCQAYSVQRDIDGPRLNMAEAAEIFRSCGVSLDWDKKFKVFEFDHEEIGGWTWFGSLVVQRYDMLEPMIKGEDHKAGKSAGSTLLDIAIDAGERRSPPIGIWAPLPRPQFDGNMDTMRRMIPDLISLFRSIKDVLRRGWAPAT
ncbi:hypothetical protein [Nitrospirillum pindoramense]|uniref:Uncharacterized protein n=1 Tax=Nitrospirillum amazonense TaxID=28077 RepID=A0A560GH88_9PROT|nr:hypothetical protein [Nitrospirillum amazonense]TWB33266.1 hypothetical protein FBZ90_1358 [Nitrospirillum amazonense]